MNIPALITLPYIAPTNAPAEDDNSDQYSQSFPEFFIENFSKKGDKIFDPFLGFGTTAFAAEKLGRIPFGIEEDELRFQWAAGQLESWQNIRHADAADANGLGFPKIDLLVTSPPFMKVTDTWNPLYGGDPAFKGYQAYLTRLEKIFAQLVPLMKRGAPLIIHADNITCKRSFTPLIRDMSLAVENAGFKPKAQTTIIWEGAPRNAPFTNALIYTKQHLNM